MKRSPDGGMSELVMMRSSSVCRLGLGSLIEILHNGLDRGYVVLAAAQLSLIFDLVAYVILMDFPD